MKKNSRASTKTRHMRVCRERGQGQGGGGHERESRRPHF